VVALTDRTVAELLDRIAAREPAPGGGTAPALTAATAAALVQMATAYGPESGSGLWAAELQARLLELAEADLRSYQPVLAALRLEREAPGRAAAVEAALSAAAEVPLAITTAAAEVAELGADAARSSSPHLIGDATAAVLLAEAAARAAARLVELKLERARDHPRRRIAADSARRAWAARGATGVFPPGAPG
jgi:methenyltetrahydrofolate cyclohydrolase